MKKIFSIVLLILFAAQPVLATTDPFSPEASETESKSVEELVQEATSLFIAQKPLEARSKLLQAIQVAPDDYRPYLLLSEYYLIEVGHFRLAFRYIKKAEELFVEKHGDNDTKKLPKHLWQAHASILYLLAESHLNLDDYEGALEQLDRFGAKYWKPSYPGSRAWVLMKLKRLEEAVSVAQAGLLRGAEQGRTLNILGILFSIMDKRELSLRAFAKAVKAEKSLGALGQPATPYNNAGEVYREIFQEEFAEGSWRQALSSPDGCSHILPSLNLAVLGIDDLRLLMAERALKDFQACFHEDSEREDTEHRALLSMARARINLRMGNANLANDFISDALARKQWFGKIGTNANDLELAGLTIKSQTLRAKANELKDTHTTSIKDSLTNLLLVPTLKLQSWWMEKQARNLALDDLEDFEDLWIRNTDTMLEYPSLGHMVSGFPISSLKTRLARLKDRDRRDMAHLYYDSYIGFAELRHGDTEVGEKKLKAVFEKLRENDRLLKAEILAALLVHEQDSPFFWEDLSTEEVRMTEQLFEILPANIRQYDLKLPVKVVRGESVGENAEDVLEMVLEDRFEVVGNGRFVIKLSRSEVVLVDSKGGKRVFGVDVSSVGEGESGDGGSLEGSANKFVGGVFGWSGD